MKDLSTSLFEKGWTLTSGAVTASMMTVQKKEGTVIMSLTLKQDADGVQLHRLRATPEFQGGGSVALAELCASANQTGTTLTLKVRPFGSQSLSETALERFYAARGFDPDPYASDYSAMIRHPNPPDTRPYLNESVSL